MLGTVAKRERRSLWATLSLLLALGIGGCVFLAGSERSTATEAAEDEARLAAKQAGSFVTKKKPRSRGPSPARVRSERPSR